MRWWEQAVEKKGVSFSMYFLGLLSGLYGLGWSIKKSLYAARILRQKQLSVPVLSVGNITLGGTGKTPVVEALARALLEAGYRPAILSRGYRSKLKQGVVSDGYCLRMTSDEAGDEPFLLAKQLPGVPVLIGRDRYQSGLTAIRHFGAQVILLDDGFQQRFRLKRDLELLVVDALRPLQRERLFPAGWLREPLSELKKADGFIICHSDDSLESRALIDFLKVRNPGAFVWKGTHEPLHYEMWPTGQKKNLSSLKGKKVLALSSLGNPRSFENTLAGLKADIIGRLRFPDHHRYTREEIVNIRALSSQTGNTPIVTTAKDSVRLPVVLDFSAWVLKIKLTIKQPGQVIRSVLVKAMHPRSHLQKPELKKILILRFSSMGDVILTLPILKLLREHFPLSTIEFLTKQPYAPLMERCSGLDRVVVVTRQDSLGTLIRRVKQEKYDCVLDLQGNWKSRVLSWSSGAKFRAQYPRQSLARRWLSWQKLFQAKGADPVALRYAATLKKIGVKASFLDVQEKGTSLEVSRQDQAEARTLFKINGVKGGKVLVLAPGAKWPVKRWPAEYFSEVARAYREKGWNVVVVGSEEERGLAARVCGQAGAFMVNLAGQTPLPLLAAVLQKAKLGVSNDSGIMHLALAVGTPTVALFGPTHYGLGFRPWQSQCRVLEKDLFCRPCSLHGRRACYLKTHQCLRSILPQEVIEAGMGLGKKGISKNHK